jgi:hypothetical protein
VRRGPGRGTHPTYLGGTGRTYHGLGLGLELVWSGLAWGWKRDPPGLEGTWTFVHRRQSRCGTVLFGQQAGSLGECAAEGSPPPPSLAVDEGLGCWYGMGPGSME